MLLGDILLRQRLITREQLQIALDAQRSYGGRLGTNLVRRGYLDVDVLARALSEQHGVPAVLRQHFEAIDKRMLSVFPPRIVSSYKAIPVGYTGTKPSRVLVACADPAKVPREELGFAAGCRVEVCVAPEMVIDEFLETYFGIARPPSPYVDMSVNAMASSSTLTIQRNAVESVPPAPRAPPPPNPPASLPREEPPTNARPQVPAPAPARPVLPGLSPPPPAPTVTRVLEPPPVPMTVPATPVISPAPAPAPAPAVSIEEQAMPTEPEIRIEGEWGLHDVLPGARPLSAPPGALRPVIDQAEASRMIEMATTKDRVGQVLEDWLRSMFGCGLVLIIKGDMAVGWKGFFPDAEDLVEAVAIPLGKPSLFSIAHDSRTATLGAPSEDGAKVNNLFWKILRCAAPPEVLVCPVVLGERVVNLLYAHSEDTSPPPENVLADVSALAADAAAAYARLIRRERGKR